MKTLIGSIIAVTLISIGAEARRGEGSGNGNASRNQKREQMQQGRIKQGVKSGELTAREAKKLRKGQKKIDRMQNKAMEDGVMTPKEKMRLEKAQDRQNRRIYRQKHDDQKRGDGGVGEGDGHGRGRGNGKGNGAEKRDDHPSDEHEPVPPQQDDSPESVEGNE